MHQRQYLVVFFKVVLIQHDEPYDTELERVYNNFNSISVEFDFFRHTFDHLNHLCRYAAIL